MKRFFFIAFLVLALSSAAGAVEKKESSGNAVTLLPDGTKFYSALFEGISSARSIVCMEYYAVERDTIGVALMNLLKATADRGVDVYLMVDPTGCSRGIRPTDKAFFDSWVSEKLHILPFNPDRVSNPLPRDHTKLTIIDGRTAFVGGMNFSVHNILPDDHLGLCRDLTITLAGPAVKDLQDRFLEVWNDQSKSVLSLPDPSGEIPAGGWDTTAADITVFDTYGYEIHPTPAEIYLDLIDSATSNIRLVNAYFMPSLRIRQALRRAAQRGVTVDILIGGNTDLPHSMARNPEKIGTHLEIEENIHFHVLDGVFFHAKAISIDDSALMVGSTNLDFLSRVVNYELSVLIRDASVVEDFNNLFDSDL